MTTAGDVVTAVRTRIEANRPVDSNSANIRLFWQNEDADTDGVSGLPDTPAPFAYTEFNPDAVRYPTAFGGGRGSNLYRTPGSIDAYVFVPRGWGVKPATDIAEQIANLFRGYRDTDIQCFGATVMPLGVGANIKPPGLVANEVDNYYAAVCSIEMHFDQIG